MQNTNVWISAPNYRASYGTASFGLQKNKIWIKYMRYKKFIRQWKHKLNDAGQIFVGKTTCPIRYIDTWYSLAPGKC